MATQITSKHGFTDNLWLQMAALVIVTLVVSRWSMFGEPACL